MYLKIFENVEVIYVICLFVFENIVLIGVSYLKIKFQFLNINQTRDRGLKMPLPIQICDNIEQYVINTLYLNVVNSYLMGTETSFLLYCQKLRHVLGLKQLFSLVSFFIWSNFEFYLMNALVYVILSGYPVRLFHWVISSGYLVRITQ